MKNIILSALASVVFISLVGCGSTNIQPAPESKLDSLLTFDEANLRLTDWRTKVGNLDRRNTEISNEVSSLMEKLTAEKNALKACNDAIYELIKASESDVSNFRERMGHLEGKIRELRNLDDENFEMRKAEVYDLAKEWNALRLMKISVLPEFFDRMTQARADINTLMGRKVVKKTKNYIVRSWEEYRDCLWNIAGQSEIYGDPFQWVKLWQGNSNIIRNPDIIRQGMELSVPPPGPKTSEEQKAERMYWRKKKAAQAMAKLPENATPAITPAPSTTPPSPSKKMDDKGEKKGN